MTSCYNCRTCTDYSIVSKDARASTLPLLLSIHAVSTNNIYIHSAALLSKQKREFSNTNFEIGKG